MGEQFDASRPIYAQLVDRLKARIRVKRSQSFYGKIYEV